MPRADPGGVGTRHRPLWFTGLSVGEVAGVGSVTGRWWSDDDGLLAALGEALRSARCVPRRFVEVGKAGYAWHNIDAELAALVSDSATGDRGATPSVVRAEPAPLRFLTFASPRLSIHMEVTRDGVHGQVVPPQPGEIELRPADGPPVVLAIDDVGWFALEPIPSGLFRLRCQTRDGTTVLTDWIRL